MKDPFVGLIHFFPINKGNLKGSRSQSYNHHGDSRLKAFYFSLLCALRLDMAGVIRAKERKWVASTSIASLTNLEHPSQAHAWSSWFSFGRTLLGDCKTFGTWDLAAHVDTWGRAYEV